MNIDIKDIMNNILKSVSKIDYIKPEDLPNIHLYMDQVTTFMDAQLESTKRHQIGRASCRESEFCWV